MDEFINFQTNKISSSVDKAACIFNQDSYVKSDISSSNNKRLSFISDQPSRINKPCVVALKNNKTFKMKKYTHDNYR